MSQDSVGFDRSLDLIADREDFLAKALGYGHTGPGRLLVNQYLRQLAVSIAADRPNGRSKDVWNGRSKDVWDALAGFDDYTLSKRLLTAGVSLCHSTTIGADRRTGEKNLRDTLLWIGRSLRLDGRRADLNLKVGIWGTRLQETLPIFVVHDDGLIDIELTDAQDESLNAIVQLAAEHHSILLSPMFSRPEPWTEFRKGGLPADHDWRVPLIAEHHPSIEAAVSGAIASGKMRRVLDALNYLQDTAFVINRPLFEFMRRAPRPPVPEPAIYEPWKKSSRKEWAAWQKAKAFELDLAIAEVTAAVDRFWQPLHFDFRGRINPICYFNYTRKDHVRALFLFADGQPIGEEGTRQLKAHVARMADGNAWSREPKPSRLDLEGRIAWTEEYLRTLCDIGEAVLRGDDFASIKYLLPSDDDEPWQFLAACIELARALKIGPKFKTQLPLIYDACCSGLQHISGMTRSEEGRYVNITPQAEGGDRVVLDLDGDIIDAVVERSAGADFYGMMALALWKRLRICPRLQQLMNGPADRKIVKRPIVSFFYGGTLKGMADAVRKVLGERNDKKRKKGEKPTPIRGDRFALYQANGFTYGKFSSLQFKTYKVDTTILKSRGAANAGSSVMAKKKAKKKKRIEYGRFVGRDLPYMFVKILDRMVAENAPVAVGVRTFLRELAGICAKPKHNKPLCFTTPLGFPVIGAYYEPIIKRFAVPTRGGRRYISLTVGHTDKIEPRDAANGIAANFVHAADACHLQMIALAIELEAIEEAIPMPMVSVHDCFAFLACHAARGNEIIRDQWDRLHENNLLNEVRESARRDLPNTVKLPDTPPRGNQDNKQIAKSFFAFN